MSNHTSRVESVAERLGGTIKRVIGRILGPPRERAEGEKATQGEQQAGAKAAEREREPRDQKPAS
jgi:hypothetical protein